MTAVEFDSSAARKATAATRRHRSRAALSITQRLPCHHSSAPSLTRHFTIGPQRTVVNKYVYLRLQQCGAFRATQAHSGVKACCIPCAPGRRPTTQYRRTLVATVLLAQNPLFKPTRSPIHCPIARPLQSAHLLPLARLPPSRLLPHRHARYPLRQHRSSQAGALLVLLLAAAAPRHVRSPAHARTLAEEADMMLHRRLSVT